MVNCMDWPDESIDVWFHDTTAETPLLEGTPVGLESWPDACQNSYLLWQCEADLPTRRGQDHDAAV